MKIKTYSVRDAHEPISRHEGFKARSMSGATVEAGQHFNAGDLPHEYLRELRETLERDGSAYVVWSYSTPIAWTSESGTVVPPVRYSVTTSQHQSTARYGLTGRVGYVPTERRAVPAGIYGPRDGWY